MHRVTEIRAKLTGLIYQLIKAHLVKDIIAKSVRTFFFIHRNTYSVLGSEINSI